MPQSSQVIRLHPLGWENDAEEERFKLSVIDSTPCAAYNHYVLFFRLDDSKKGEAVPTLIKALEVVLSQARFMCGTIERDPEGGHSFVKKRTSTVKLVVRHLDAPRGGLSLSEIEGFHFGCHALGPLELLSPEPYMVWGEGSSAADPDCSPIVSAFQVTFIRGGMLFGMHSHHWASDLKGWNNFTLQLADTCLAVANNTALPPWDLACVDVSRFTRHPDHWIEGPPALQRHADHRDEHQALLFHVSMSKAARLKAMASPQDGWVSTYDAMCAYLWRQLSKARAPLFQQSKETLEMPLFFGEAVNMRTRIGNPTLPERMMRNVLCGAFGDSAPVTQPTLAEVLALDDYPLSSLAGYIRRLTESCTQEHMEKLVEMIAPIRDKRSISLRVDAYSPMSMWVTDHRSGDVGHFDFGFGEPITYRHLWGENVTPGLVLIYAPIKSSPDPDEGYTFTVTIEKELVPKLLQDPGWNEFFEYRGVD
ncbi:unnamed protein product [Discula destructiva]